MPNDPVALYTAATNDEAHVLETLLAEAGIDAFAVEDHNPAGFWLLGTVSQIHKPQVWVERTDLERARTLVEAYELRQAERRQALAATPHQPIQVICEECHRTTVFAAELYGSVQNCSHCHALVDVGDDLPEEGPWSQLADDSDTPDDRDEAN